MTDVQPRTGEQVIKVLVVEGDRHLRSVLRWVLGEDGRFAVVGEAGDPHHAVSWPEPYDVALVEIGLSGIDGTGLIGELHGRAPAPLVVVLSPSGVPYLRHAAAAEGADGFLVRPADIDALGERLHQLVVTNPHA